MLIQRDSWHARSIKLDAKCNWYCWINPVILVISVPAGEISLLPLRHVLSLVRRILFSPQCSWTFLDNCWSVNADRSWSGGSHSTVQAGWERLQAPMPAFHPWALLCGLWPSCSLVSRFAIFRYFIKRSMLEMLKRVSSCSIGCSSRLPQESQEYSEDVRSKSGKPDIKICL